MSAGMNKSDSGYYMLLNRAVEFLLGFIGFMFLVRIFNRDEFGTWVLFITITSIVEMARYGFLQNGLIRFLVGEEKHAYNKIMTASVFLNALLTFIFILLLLALAQPLSEWLGTKELSGLIAVHCLVLPVHILHTQSLILLQAKMNFKAYFYSGVFKSLPFFLLIAAAYITGYDLSLAELVWLHNLALIIAALTGFFQAKEYLTFSKSLSKIWVRKIFNFGKFVFGTNLVVVLYNSLDKFLLAYLLSSAQVAISNTAMRILNFTEVPVNAIAAVTYPKAAAEASLQKGGPLSALYERSVAQMLAFTIPFLIIVFIFAKPVILIIAGKAYLDAVHFLRIIILIALFRPFDRQTGIFLDAMNKPQANFLFVVLALLLVVALSIVLISAIGLYGAAWALLISLISVTVIKQAYLRRHLPFSIKKSFFLLPAIYSEYAGLLMSRIRQKIT